jgi:predicted RecB family nuclease
MPLPVDERDAPQEPAAAPCAVCGKPSGCASWGFRLCYGDLQSGRTGCVTRLWQELPSEGEKAFTQAWVARERAKARAA